MIEEAKGGLRMELSERKKQILRAVVENYIQPNLWAPKPLWSAPA